MMKVENVIGPEIKRYKILIVGNSGVGKTSILKRFVFGKFDSNI